MPLYYLESSFPMIRSGCAGKYFSLARLAIGRGALHLRS
jgi:hypothetical protein